MRMSHGIIDSAAKKTYRTKALRSPRIMKMRRTLRTQRWTTALKTLCKIHTTTSKVSSMKSRHNSSQQLRELIALIVEHLYSGRTDLVRLMLTKEAWTLFPPKYRMLSWIHSITLIWKTRRCREVTETQLVICRLLSKECSSRINHLARTILCIWLMSKGKTMVGLSLLQ